MLDDAKAVLSMNQDFEIQLIDVVKIGTTV